eukprot:TRINITY_DN359_c0_g1_i1.p1 TRINITY_DN359_c0_g1~~TRINITY_DN359_c0_g1_i1.p1  ORF type:complete len:267 (+),score=41.54 TRINITY_DN359_c0_g1_i1:1533-2333(+)
MSSPSGSSSTSPCPDPSNSNCSPSVPVDLGLLFLVPAVAFIIGLFIFVFLMYISSRFFGFGQGRAQNIQITALAGGTSGGLHPAIRDSFPCTTLSMLREEDTAWSKAVAEDLQCAICLSEYGSEDILRQLPCRHVLHRDCIDSWLDRHTSCPTCRQTLVPPSLDAPSASSAPLLPTVSQAPTGVTCESPPANCAPGVAGGEVGGETGDQAGGEDERFSLVDLEQGGGMSMSFSQGLRSPPSRYSGEMGAHVMSEGLLKKSATMPER